ncbi:RICIN domain-containing protein [Nonomuraea sp. NPDC050404]|uniref:RICIN domain-containing protein n=1 Tax=Nonomuraea sp. NPDC050404 TaxID=3155783 RepID=UPI0033F934B7
MFASRMLRHAATAIGVAGIGAALALPAQAAAPVYKELEYRGNSAKLVMSAFGNVNGASVALQPDTNSKFGQWAQTATFSSGGGQAAFIYTLRASLESGGSALCLTAKNTVEVVVAVCDNTDGQKWFHPTAVSGPGGTLPTKNVATLRHLGQSGSSQATLSLFQQIGPHFWAKRTA